MLRLKKELMALGVFTDRWDCIEGGNHFALDLKRTKYFCIYDGNSKITEWYNDDIYYLVTFEEVWNNMPSDIKQVLIYHLDVLK